MEIHRGRGKLYRHSSEKLVGTINYKIQEESAAEPTRWWGEFTFTDSASIRDGERYTIELEDGRRGWCYLKKLVNRVVRGIPPRYVYHFTGTSPLE